MHSHVSVFVIRVRPAPGSSACLPIACLAALFALATAATAATPPPPSGKVISVLRGFEPGEDLGLQMIAYSAAKYSLTHAIIVLPDTTSIEEGMQFSRMRYRSMAAPVTVERVGRLVNHLTKV